MCSRFSLTSTPEALRACFVYGNKPVFPPRYNISPTDPVPVIRVGRDGVRELQLMRWGLIPGWVKDPGEFSTLINARSETALEKPSFRNAMRRRRCLIPADGFYEWSGPKDHRKAFHIRSLTGEPMGLAALWEHWQGADGSEMETVTILTTEPNETMAEIHNRMPAILSRDDFSTWLDCEGTSPDEAAALLKPAPDDLLEVVEVSPRINNPGDDAREVQQPRQHELF